MKPTEEKIKTSKILGKDIKNKDIVLIKKEWLLVIAIYHDEKLKRGFGLAVPVNVLKRKEWQSIKIKHSEKYEIKSS